MEYKIKYSFYSPDGKFSGLSGRTIDKELYENAIKWGYKDRVEIVGFVPATFRTDEELQQEIAELSAELDKRQRSKAKTVSSKAKTQDDGEESPQKTQKKRGRKPKKQ